MSAKPSSQPGKTTTELFYQLMAAVDEIYALKEDKSSLTVAYAWDVNRKLKELLAIQTGDRQKAYGEGKEAVQKAINKNIQDERRARSDRDLWEYGRAIGVSDQKIHETLHRPRSRHQRES